MCEWVDGLLEKNKEARWRDSYRGGGGSMPIPCALDAVVFFGRTHFGSSSRIHFSPERLTPTPTNPLPFGRLRNTAR